MFIRVHPRLIDLHRPTVTTDTTDAMDARLERLSAMCTRGAIAEAELELHRWRRADDCPATARVMLAALLARRGRIDDARAVLRSDDPDERRMHRTLDDVQGSVGEHRQAPAPATGLDRLHRAREAYDQAKAAFDGHLLGDAEHHVKLALTLEPDDAATRLLLARIQLKQFRPREALRTLDAHDLHHPDRRDVPEVAMLRIEALTGSGLGDIALGLLVKLSETFPDDARIARKLAAHYLHANRADLAAEALRRVLQLEPADGTSRRLLAQLREDRPQDGIGLLLDDHAAQDTVAKLRAARLCMKVERLRDAEVLYADLLRHDPTDQSLWIEAGRLADAMGEDAMAVARLEKAVSLSGRHKARAWAALATAHVHADRLPEAGRAWWKAARLNPDYVEAWAGLAICAWMSQRRALARRAMRALRQRTSRLQRRTLLAKFWLHAAVMHTLREQPAREAEWLAPILARIGGRDDSRRMAA